MRWGRFANPAVIVVAAAVAVAPLLIRGNSCGHDFDFHLVSWLDALHSWQAGIAYPHWAPSPNFNTGEPRFIFYPPLTWMLGAALGAVLPWGLVPSALVFVLLAATGFAVRALARQAMEDGAATLAGCVAIFSGYTLFTVYERSAFAELAGGFWIPLLLLLMLRDARPGASERRGTVLLLAVVIAGAWLSNAPVGVMASYLLAGVALVAAVMERSCRPLGRAAGGAALGLGLAAFYLVPAAWEQRWVDIRQAVDDPGLAIQNSFLFGHRGGALLALHDTELDKASWVAVAMIVVTLACVLVGWRRRTLPGSRRWWVPLGLIPVVVLVLLLPVSLPLWDVLPKLRFLQFPWRWLVAVEAPLAIFVAAAVVKGQGPEIQGSGIRDQGSERRQAGLRWIVWAAFGAVFVGLTVVAGREFFQVCDQYDAVPAMVGYYGDGGGYAGVDEYAPPGADDDMVPEDLPGACLVSDAAAVLGKITADDPQPDWAPAQKSCDATLAFAAARGRTAMLHKRIDGAVPHGGYLVLRLRRYPAWDVRVNGQRVTTMPERDDGLMVVPVSAGPVALSMDWTTTPDVRWGRRISGAACIVLAALFVLGRGAHRLRRGRSRLK
ncbi:MAG TPA: 6-pyruvoyl-tetrahydropterin synthase-related protein [Terracidiphilus sp.]|nr:6-pyruvoyl-tetrahydropterin synthase-related protein [Terracidiphilus sp.]